MIRMYYHFRVPEDHEEEAEGKLKEWVNRMVGAKGFKGAMVMEELHHFAGSHKFHGFALNHDWEAREDFKAFWDKNGQFYPVPSGHHWLAGVLEAQDEAEHGHGHEHGHEHGHDDDDHNDEMFAEQFHGHYDVVYQVP